VSNHLAVATVTAALGRRAHGAAASAIDGDVQLQYGRPVAPTGDDAKPTVHVYLYQITPNAALRNNDLPTRDSSGRLSTRPHAAIDLHYLLTFYGEAATFVPERMLGAVVRDLHARPVVDRNLIAQIAAADDLKELADTNLAKAHERVKFTQAQLSLEELSRLWSIMVQSPHALSVAYLASVVEIDALEAGPTALPVLKRGEGDRGVETTIGPFPQLDSWWAGDPAAATRRPRPPSYPAARLGDRLVLTGSNIGGDVVTLRFTHRHIAVAPTLVVPASDRDLKEVRITLPDDAPAQDAWAAGTYSVTLETQQGTESRPSGVLQVVLAPRVTSIQPNPAPRNNGAVTFTITCHPKVLKDQSATLFLAEREITAEVLADATPTLTFKVPNAAALADELIHIRIDNVPSAPFRYNPVTLGFEFDDQQKVTVT